jgi:dihydrolipoamide dehydrogenase
MTIAIIGGGPAGRTAAIRLAAAGEVVQLIESGGLGGQCLHHGCMVICALNDVARHLEQSATLTRQGILASTPDLDFPALLTSMASVQATIRDVLDRETEDAGVEVIRGAEASLNGATLLRNDREVEADSILVATGSRPNIPDIPGTGLSGVYTPHTLASMNRLPDRIAIIGGGIIAAEYAHIFRAFGSEVEMLCRSTLLREMDDRQREAARKDLETVVIREQTHVTEIRGGGGVGSVVVERDGEGDEIGVDAVMLATGLVPRTDLINGLNKGELGEIRVDRHMRTSIEGVYAAGDVTGPPYLTPVARREGVVAAETILGRAAEMDYTGIPQSLHLRNEHSFCRLPAEEHVALGIPSPAGPGSFWSVSDRNTGMAKIEIEPESGRITGVYSSSPGSAMITAYLAYLMKKGESVHDLKDILEVHPSTDGIYWLIKYSSDWLKRSSD